MSSLVIYGNEFEGQLLNGLTPQFFKYRFLAEGDSWMDRSAMFHTSLLQQLAQKMDQIGEDVLIINLAQFGDTMHRIGESVNGDFRQWVNTAFDWKFDAVLLSAGGNDFIDAARNPDPGKGILKNFPNGIVPVSAGDCLDRSAVDTLVTKYLNPNFSALYAEVQSSRHAGIPVFLNCYDTPTARNAPAFPGGRAWLFPSYTKNNIPPGMWPALTGSIFNEIQSTIAGWRTGRANVHAVPTNGTLVAAAAGAPGDSGDWLNEIHPNGAGWDKLAAVWRTTLKNELP